MSDKPDLELEQKAAAARGVDMHTAAAAEMFNVLPEEVTPAQRQATMSKNFGACYGGTVSGRFDHRQENQANIWRRTDEHRMQPGLEALQPALAKLRFALVHLLDGDIKIEAKEREGLLQELNALGQQAASIVAGCYEGRHAALEPVERVYNRDWHAVLEPDGAFDKEQMKKELADYSFVLSQISEVYSEITGGLLSKPNYFAGGVLRAADDHQQQLCEECQQGAAEAKEP